MHASTALAKLKRLQASISTQIIYRAPPLAFCSDHQARLLSSGASLAHTDGDQSRSEHSASDEDSLGSANSASERQPTAAGSHELDGSPAEAKVQPPSLSQYIEGLEAALAANSSRPKKRSLTAYNALVEHLSQNRKAHLLRDVLDEMQVDGVSPNWQTWSAALAAATRQRMLPDACFFFSELQRTGHKPTSQTYATMITAAGRAGQFQHAMKLVEEMKQRKLEVTRNVQMALVGCYSQAGMVGPALATMEDMMDRGLDLEVRVITDIMRAAKENAMQKLTPASRTQAKLEVERLLIKATELFDLEAHADDRDLLLSGAMDAYVELGLHEEVRQAFNNLTCPNHSCHNFLIFSNFQEVAKHVEDEPAPTAARLADFYRGCRETVAMLRQLEAKDVPLRVPYAYQIMLVVLKTEEHRTRSGASIPPDDSPDTKQPMELARAVLEHIHTTGQFISEIYGSLLVYRAARLRSRESAEFGNAITRSMARTGHVPDCSALQSLLAANRLHRREDTATLTELQKTLHARRKRSSSSGSTASQPQ